MVSSPSHPQAARSSRRRRRLAPGTVIDGRYRVVRFIAAGGMGDVYVVRHILMDRVVALKLLSLPPSGDTALYEERFRREAHVAAKIDHPNVVRTYDFGFFEGLPYIVMQLLHGHDLSRELRNEGDLFTSRGMQLFGDAIAAVAAAHAHGVVHKDLKPSNLFIDAVGTPTERTVVLDFGVAQGQDAAIARLTRTGTIAGTPEYLAPEYIADQEVAPQIDVYSLGLILVEVITGTRVVRGETLYDKLVFHMSKSVPIPDVVRGTRMEDVIARATERDATARYKDATAMLQDYQRALRELIAHPRWSGEEIAYVPSPSGPLPQMTETLDGPSVDAEAVDNSQPGRATPPSVVSVVAEYLKPLEDPGTATDLGAFPANSPVIAHHPGQTLKQRKGETTAFDPQAESHIGRPWSDDSDFVPSRRAAAPLITPLPAVERISSDVDVLSAVLHNACAMTGAAGGFVADPDYLPVAAEGIGPAVMDLAHGTLALLRSVATASDQSLRHGRVSVELSTGGALYVLWVLHGEERWSLGLLVSNALSRTQCDDIRMSLLSALERAR